MKQLNYTKDDEHNKWYINNRPWTLVMIKSSIQILNIKVPFSTEEYLVRFNWVDYGDK